MINLCQKDERTTKKLAIHRFEAGIPLRNSKPPSLLGGLRAFPRQRWRWRISRRTFFLSPTTEAAESTLLLLGLRLLRRRASCVPSRVRGVIRLLLPFLACLLRGLLGLLRSLLVDLPARNWRRRRGVSRLPCRTRRRRGWRRRGGDGPSARWRRRRTRGRGRLRRRRGWRRNRRALAGPPARGRRRRRGWCWRRHTGGVRDECSRPRPSRLLACVEFCRPCRIGRSSFFCRKSPAGQPAGRENDYHNRLIHTRGGGWPVGRGRYSGATYKTSIKITEFKDSIFKFLLWAVYSVILGGRHRIAAQGDSKRQAARRPPRLRVR